MDTPLGASYVLGQVIGRGGMGTVHAGRDHAGHRYAIKVLRRDLAADAAFVARFVGERSVLAGVRSGYLVAVHDLVVEGATLALVMDLVEGGDLRRELAALGPLPPAEVCRIGSGVARGLAAVHEAGVVHRDVKPENILLDRATVPYGTRLTDFGIARLTETSADRATVLVGTPDYIAPELVGGALPAPSCDLYALGIVLYELCCGVTPFAGGPVMAVLRRHVELPPARPAGVPDALWGVVAALLAKDPAARPPSARNVATVLAGLVVDLAGCPAAPRAGAFALAGLALPVLPAARAARPAAVPAAAPAGRGRSVLVGSLALLLPVLGVAFVQSLDSGSTPDDVVSATVAFFSESATLVPADTNAGTDLFVKDVDGGTTVRASTASDGAQAEPSARADRAALRVALSADGRTVAFGSQAANLVPGDSNGTDDVFVKDLGTGSIVRASSAADGTQANKASGYQGLAVSADGTTVAFESAASNLVPGDTNKAADVFVKDLASGRVVRASTTSTGAQVPSASASASLSADGRTVAFDSEAAGLTPGDTNRVKDVYVKDLGTGEITRASLAGDGGQGDGYSAAPVLAADGRSLVFLSVASTLVTGDDNGAADVFLGIRS